MDIKRQRSKRRGWFRTGVVILLVISLVGLTSFALSRLEPAVPTDQRSVMYGTVERGTMVREIPGTGSLVPIEITYVTAAVGGRVTNIALEPGVEVEESTVLIEMDDPQIERNVVEAERSLKSVEAERQRFELLLEKESLDLKAATAGARARWEEANNQAQMDTELARKGLKSDRERRLSKSRAEQNWTLYELQLARVDNSQQSNKIQLSEKQVAVERAQAVLEDRKREREELTVRATTTGILQQLGPTPTSRLEAGQRVTAGSVVAVITNPQKLKAVLNISEVQARDVTIGQSVTIDTRSAVIPGHVIRIDPAVQNGTVAVDVELLDELPRGARPDLSVNGTIEIERLEDVLYVDRPVYSQSESTVSLFQVGPDGLSAVRTEIEFGRSSVNTIEVRRGLEEGDRVILSDMKRWDDVDRVRLENN